MIKREMAGRYQNIGLLILRIGIGIMFILHGFPKLAGGPDMWKQVGMTVHTMGIDFLPVVFGFLAGITEFFGGMLLILGIFFRPALAFMTIVMIVATSTHIAAGDPFAIFSHPIEIGIVLISLIFLGPGTYSLQNKLPSQNRRW